MPYDEPLRSEDGQPSYERDMPECELRDDDGKLVTIMSPDYLYWRDKRNKEQLQITN